MDHPTYKPDGGKTEYQEYYESVELAVDYIEEALEEDPQAEISELVWEEVDTSEYIIYYEKNMTVLEVSDNEPGEWKHLVSEGDDWRNVIQALAYSTMEQDIWDEVRDRDLE